MMKMEVSWKTQAEQEEEARRQGGYNIKEKLNWHGTGKRNIYPDIHRCWLIETKAVSRIRKLNLPNMVV